MGCEIGACRDADEMLEVREEEMYVTGVSAAKAAGVCVVAEVSFLDRSDICSQNKFYDSLQFGMSQLNGSSTRVSP
jgi:hypothetical protein